MSMYNKRNATATTQHRHRQDRPRARITTENYSPAAEALEAARTREETASNNLCLMEEFSPPPEEAGRVSSMDL
eukprot:scaffold7679_cov96-Skeletonema_marinoi.AAC.7